MTEPPPIRERGGAAQLIRYELASDLASGGSATAKIVEWGGGGGSYFAQTEPLVTIVDAVGIPRQYTGERGYAVYMGDRGMFEPLAPSNTPLFWLFEITGGPSLDGGNIRYWTASRVVFGGTLYAIGVPTGVSIYDPIGGANTDSNQPATTGDWLWATYNEGSGRWEIVRGPDIAQRIELTGNLSSGSASAKLLIYSGGAYSTVGSAFTVYDYLNKFRSAKTGYRGWILWASDRGVRELVQLQHKARWITGTLSGSLTTGDNTIAAAKTDFWDGEDPGTIGSVTNTLNLFSGASGDKFLACYDDVEDVYKLVQLYCP